MLDWDLNTPLTMNLISFSSELKMKKKLANGIIQKKKRSKVILNQIAKPQSNKK